MKYPTTRIIFDRHGRASKTIAGLVQIEVTLARKRKFIGTGVKVYKHEWSDKTHVKGRMDSIVLNQRIDAYLQNINNYITDTVNNGRAWDWDAFEKFLDRRPTSVNTFLAFVESRIENRTDLRHGTHKHHRSWYEDFANWGQIVTFSDITVSNVRLYDDYLRTKGLRQTTVYNYHKHLKSYIYDAIECELLSVNPYRSVKIDKGRCEELRYLTQEEVNLIRYADLSDPVLCKARDVFIFQCHTGMAYADLAAFRIEDCVEKNGRLVYTNKRVKTDGKFTVMILPPAMEILKKYDNKLPLISNQKYNVYLKVIQQSLGIKTQITSHVARHSFAVMAINNGVPIEIIAQMMGHTKINTTQIYAKVLNESVENAFLELEKKL